MSELHSQVSLKSLLPVTNSRQLALNLMRPNRDTSESAKEFVMNSRCILMKEISIQDKKEETKRLIEFIQMEQEKLTESKRTFDDDREGYERYLDQLRTDVASIEEDVKLLIDQKIKKKDEIRLCLTKKQDIITELGKFEDQLEVHKANKEFVDSVGTHTTIYFA